jgi:divalent metal cation (Fe/Co/Zn/Cd) transporter
VSEDLADRPCGTEALHGELFVVETVEEVRRETAVVGDPRVHVHPAIMADGARCSIWEHVGDMSTSASPLRTAALLRRGRALEVATLSWNVVGIVILAIAAWQARSVALVGFGLDSLIEIGASTVVLWELAGVHDERQHRALRLIAAAFLALAGYLLVQSAVVLSTGFHPHPSSLGIVWTAITAVAMFVLAAGKARTGGEMHNPVLVTEGRVTFIDGLLAGAVLIGLVLNSLLGWWWADPAAGLVIVYYAVKEASAISRDLRSAT